MKFSRRSFTGAFGAALGMATLSRTPLSAMDSTPAGHHGHDDVTPTHQGSGTSAVFMTITNNGDEDDVLKSADADVAEIVEVHEMIMEGDTMKMRELADGLPIPAGETVKLEKGGYHVMLINLTQDLMRGVEFDLTLTFEKAGEVTLTAYVDADAHDDSTEVEDLVIAGVHARPAPMLGGMDHGTPVATPSH